MTTHKKQFLIHGRMHWRRYLGCGLSVLILAGCAGEMQRREGMALVQDGRYEDGLAKLEEALRTSPDNAKIRKDFLSQRDLLINRFMNNAASERSAERYDAAEALYRRVLGFDPNFAAAKKGLVDVDMDRRHTKLLAEAQSLAKKGDMEGAKARLTLIAVENPGNVKASQLRYQLEEPTLKENIAGPTLNIKGRKPVTLQFRDANLKMVLEAISRTTGVNVLLDKDVRNDIKVTIFVKDTPVEETLDLILFQNQLEKRVMGENTVLIYPFNPAKSKDYQELKVRRFALTNADPKQVQSMIKTIIKTKDIFVDEKTNAIVIRDTAQAVRLAEKLVVAMDQPEAEVMLDIDVMTVNRDRAMQLGLDLPTSYGWSIKSMDLNAFRNRTATDITVDGLKATAQFSKTDADVNNLASPKIRVRNREKAKILIGVRNPVVSSAATPAATTGTSVYNTSIQYVETGIKLEVEPTIHSDGDVAIKLNIEVSAAGEQNAEAAKNGTIVFPVSTNTLMTLLQLKDGETQIMGGLIQNQSSSSQTSIPGLGDIPLLGRLFGSAKDTWNKDELVLAITPHIVRNNAVNEADLVELWSGTESNLKFGAPNMKVAGTGGVLGQGAAAAATPAIAPAAARPPGLAGVPTAAGPVRATAPPVVVAPSGAAAAGPLAVTLAGPQQAKIGDKLNVIVAAQPGASVNAVTFALRYDTEFLKAVTVTEGDLMRRANIKSNFNGQIDEAGGSVAVDLSAEGGGAAGGGGIASIQFEVIGGRGSTAVSVASINATGANSSELPVTSPAPLSVTVQAPP
jgi:general secretion pathway protein D